MTPAISLWVYIVLLVLGGLMGFIKAGSKPSLIASVAFAIALSACQFMPRLNELHVPDVLLVLLLVVFGMRLAKTRKFMPSGLMIGLTALTLVLRHML